MAKQLLSPEDWLSQSQKPAKEEPPWYVASPTAWERIKKAKKEKDLFLEKRKVDPSYGMRKDPDAELKQAIRTSVDEFVDKSVEEAKILAEPILKSPGVEAWQRLRRPIEQLAAGKTIEGPI